MAGAGLGQHAKVPLTLGERARCYVLRRIGPELCTYSASSKLMPAELSETGAAASGAVFLFLFFTLTLELDFRVQALGWGGSTGGFHLMPITPRAKCATEQALQPGGYLQEAVAARA